MGYKMKVYAEIDEIKFNITHFSRKEEKTLNNAIIIGAK